MNSFLLWMHPLMQAGAALIGFWAMWQGIRRVQMLLGKKIIFPWKQHVRLGAWGLGLWTLGAMAFYTTHAVFGQAHITGTHAVLAWPIVGISMFGLISGYIMNRYKKKRKWLPILHGISNSILVCLVLLECWTGIVLCFQFL